MTPTPGPHRLNCVIQESLSAEIASLLRKSLTGDQNSPHRLRLLIQHSGKWRSPIADRRRCRDVFHRCRAAGLAEMAGGSPRACVGSGRLSSVIPAAASSPAQSNSHQHNGVFETRQQQHGKAHEVQGIRLNRAANIVDHLWRRRRRWNPDRRGRRHQTQSPAHCIGWRNQLDRYSRQLRHRTF